MQHEMPQLIHQGHLGIELSQDRAKTAIFWLGMMRQIEERTWGTEHITTSPAFPRSNGFIERNSQTIKKLFKKAKESKEDPDISILNYRAAPKTNAKSPAELLMGRKIRTLQPIVKYHRKKNKDKENSCFSKQRYDQHTCRLPELKPGAYIRYRHKGLWEPAQVVSRATTLRSYIIKTKDGMLRRNRQHLLVNGEKHHSLIPTPVEYTPRYEHQPDSLQQSAPAAPYQEVPEQPNNGVPA
ncbi:hypothetical protein RRG08_027843 [Elysia crispata]|uniref:Integrase catalytic domain-containing protein n=1 Tax=Elysia crispata TaxID=231223 RepID=A0AAE1DEL3_9GAST|nr:hypothetical protein RRG08_022735 [Elysia crispata]KAK3802854.1 hypothetical protein RRG08_027843 [Elysia crispata]